MLTLHYRNSVRLALNERPLEDTCAKLLPGNLRRVGGVRDVRERPRPATLARLHGPDEVPIMKQSIVAVVLFTLCLFTSVPARAADAKLVAGITLLSAGSLMMVGAFSYDTSCPPGYSTHTFQNLPTQCVYVGASGSDVRDIPTTATLERRGVLYGGIAVATAGAVALLMPKRVKKIAPELTITPIGWKASRTFRF